MIKERNEFDLNVVEFIELLSQFRVKSTTLTTKEYSDVLERFPENQKIFFYLNKDFSLMGCVSILLEQKLYHECKLVCHIEDLIVDHNHQRKGIGTKLINHVLNYAETQGCYKVILNCKEELEKYYERNGFNKKEIQMSIYLNDKRNNIEI